jgi:hypothetical protein
MRRLDAELSMMTASKMSDLNIPSECRIASIDLDHAMILAHDANPSHSGSCAFSVPKRAALVTIISVKPMMALSGVRSSWLMLDGGERAGCKSKGSVQTLSHFWFRAERPVCRN